MLTCPKSTREKKMFLPELHEGLEALFKLLGKQKIRQFILSASEQDLLNKAVAHYKIGSFFNGVYGVDNLNAVGEKELGVVLCRKHNLKIKETILIGDTEYDQEVAEKIGCEVVLVSLGHINHQRLLKTNNMTVLNFDNLII